MKRITSLKQRIISACLAGCVMLSGAGILLYPAQTFAYAAGDDEPNSWVVAPSISGWSYDSFGAGNLFSAIPARGAEKPYAFTFTKDGDDSFKFPAIYAAVENGVFTYYMDKNGNNDYSANEMLEYAQQTLAKWKPGNYTMTVTVEKYISYEGITASVPFTVEQAENYWTQVPTIVSWSHNNRDYSTPTGEAKFGSVQYTIYSAETDSNGNYITDDDEYVKDVLYYDSVNDINNLKTAEEGIYLLVAKVAETAEYKGLETTLVFRVFSSEATKAELDAAKEDAIEQVEARAHELGVTTNASASIKGANTLKEVASVLEIALLDVYRTYAEKEIKDYAKGKVNDYETVVATQLSDIRQNANTDKQILAALDSAKQVIEQTYVQNTLAPEKVTELREYAQNMAALADGMTISTDSLEKPIENAKTEKAVALALTAAKKTVASQAYEHGSSNLNNFRMLAKHVIEQTAWYIGIEYKGDGTDSSSNVVVRFVEEAITGEKTQAQIKAVVTQALETEFVAILTTMQANLRADLEQIATRYAEQYSSVAAQLNQIITQAKTGMYQPDTFAKSEEKYEAYLADIKVCVLEPAKAEAIQQIDDLLEETGLKSFDRQKAVDAINAATSIEEMEKILDAAINEIGSTLYGARAEKIAELEAYAEEYYAEYNWRALLDSLNAGKAAINGAQKYADILGKFENAKITFYKTYVLAELNRYAEIYGEYGISEAVAYAKSALAYARTEEECTALLSDAETTMCAAAKESAASYLERDNPFYASWDRAPWVSQIKEAQTIAKVDELYQRAVAERSALVEARDSAIAAAQEMLRIYAGSYGDDIANNKDVETAITEVSRAQTEKDVDLLFDIAKGKIDEIAEAEQQRVDSVNTALVVLVVLFGFIAVGLGVAFGLILHRYMPKKKKGGKGRRNQPRQNAQGQIPPQQNMPQTQPLQEQPPQGTLWQEQLQQNPFLQGQLQYTPPQGQPQEELPQPQTEQPQQWIQPQTEQSQTEQPQQELSQPQEEQAQQEPPQTPPEN